MCISGNLTNSKTLEKSKTKNAESFHKFQKEKKNKNEIEKRKASTKGGTELERDERKKNGRVIQKLEKKMKRKKKGM